MKKKANGPCPQCGSPMAKRKGPFGEFFGCSKYPQCKGVRKLNEAPVAPQNKQPQAPQPRPPEAAMQPEKQRTWILATMIATGEPVVAAKGATGWDYQTENGGFGTIPNIEVAKTTKGLEFDRVFILEPNLFPHPKAKTPEELTQEENAKYVAFTRAMKGLHVLAPTKEEKREKKEASSKGDWYIRAKNSKKRKKKLNKESQNLTPQQIGLYQNFKTPSGIKLIGNGLSSVFQLPGINQTLNGSQLMNQVIARIKNVLIQKNVHTIDTSSVSRSDAIGLAVSSEPGTIHVDIQKIFETIKNQALPSITQLDGIEIDKDIQNDIIGKISSYIINQLANTAAHESKHNMDYFNSFPKGKFESSESGAEGFGNQVANQYFKL